MVELRNYQHELLGKASAAYRAVRAVLIQLATGGGKSQIGAAAASRALAKGRSVFWITHRRELIKQVSRTLTAWGIPHGIISAGFPMALHHNMQICSLDTLRRRFDKVSAPGLIIWDEARHLAANTWKAVYEKWPLACHLGLDATPQRNDGKGLAEFFKEMVRGPEMRWLIENKYLADYCLYAPESPDLSGLHTRYGDYVQKELEDTFDKQAIIGNAVEHYRRFAAGKRALIFCVSIKASQGIAEAFRAANIPAVHADGNMATEIRDGVLEDFTAGRIMVVSSVSLFTEGLDIAGVECIIQLRPTQSRALYLQMIGRGLRPSPGKERCVILDACSNWQMHGLPTEPYDWQLTYDEQTKRKSKPPSVRVCASCFCALAAGTQVCPECGYKFPPKPREVIERDGMLVELTPEEIARRAEKRKLGFQRSQAQTLEEMIAYGRAKGVKGNLERWAQHVLAARQQKRQRA